ncbi:hypothetical protein QYF36_016188 [Acer negundo]|nr:hypothetical protein QYF36_016188 [Acer negundo]
MGLAEIVVVVIIVGSVRDWAMAAAIPSTAPAHVVALSLDKLSSDLWSSDLRVLFRSSISKVVNSFVSSFGPSISDVRPPSALPPTYQSSQSHHVYFDSSAFFSKGFMSVPQPKLVLASVVGFMILYAKMYSSKKKIQKDHDAEPTEFEETVAQALFDLGNTNQELKSDLKDLYINQAMYDCMAWLLC